MEKRKLCKQILYNIGTKERHRKIKQKNYFFAVKKK